MAPHFKVCMIFDLAYNKLNTIISQREQNKIYVILLYNT